MTSPLPDLASSIATTTTPATSRSAAPSLASTTTGESGSRFAGLMNLQARSRAIEAKLHAQPAGSGDPAAEARHHQASFNAAQLKELRTLVGPAPGSNARRALAALVARLESGGVLTGTDQLRIKLAIAADERRIDASGATQVKDAILGLESTLKTFDSQAGDPTMVQDRARLAVFQRQNALAQRHADQIGRALDGGQVNPAAIRALLDPPKA